VLDPAAVAAAAAMINSAIGAGGVTSLRLTPGTGLQFNAGRPDAVTLHAADGGLSLTAPLAAAAAPGPGPAPGAIPAAAAAPGAAPGPAAAPAAGTATVRLRLPVSAGAAIGALPRLAFSIVPDPTGGLATGAAQGAAAALGAGADAGSAVVPGAAAGGGGPLAFLAGALG